MLAQTPTPEKAAAAERSEDMERLDAVRRRDHAWDGAFVYAVVTTGVFCRPSCPSRPARRENMVFYASPSAAERAGFRACKRCQPDKSLGTDPHLAIVAEACKRIERAEVTIKLTTLARTVSMSPYHFHRVFKKVTGVTPKAYAAALRAGRVRTELARGRDVTGALFSAGYGASSRFYAEARQRLGMKPAAYRAGGSGRTIRFAVAESSLGHILVAATEKGVCAIEFGDDATSLVHSLNERFAQAKLVGDDKDFARLVAGVVSFVEEPRRGLDLPLDVRGTAFQERVWAALRSIPSGRTATYSEVAAAIGSPRSVRAVAQACAKNPVALAIPCHRVVRSDGALSGYRWGASRKSQLLARESGRR